MELGVKLKDLIEGVQLEVGHSTNPLVGVNYRETISAAIRREYRRLHADFDWPHLLYWEDFTTAQNVSEYSVDAGLLPRIVEVWAKTGADPWAPLCRGITLDDYNEADPEGGELRDPALKWKPKGADALEIWPRPQSAGQLRLVCKSAPLPLQDQDEECDLDADLVILHAAASVLFKGNSERAGLILQRGRNHYATLRQRLQTGSVRVRLGAR